MIEVFTGIISGIVSGLGMGGGTIPVSYTHLTPKQIKEDTGTTNLRDAFFTMIGGGSDEE